MDLIMLWYWRAAEHLWMFRREFFVFFLCVERKSKSEIIDNNNNNIKTWMNEWMNGCFEKMHIFTSGRTCVDCNGVCLLFHSICFLILVFFYCCNELYFLVFWAMMVPLFLAAYKEIRDVLQYVYLMLFFLICSIWWKHPMDERRWLKHPFGWSLHSIQKPFHNLFLLINDREVFRFDSYAVFLVFCFVFFITLSYMA